MPERGDDRSARNAALAADLPGICRLGRSPAEAWHFVAPLSRRLNEITPHDGLTLLWVAGDGRSFRVVAACGRGAEPRPNASGERAERTAIATSPLRKVLTGEAMLVADSTAVAPCDTLGSSEGTQAAAGARSWLAVPFTSGGSVRGALVATSTEIDAFATDDVAILASVADAIEPFVEGALLLEQSGEQEQRRRSFQAINLALAGSLDLRKVFDGVVDAVRPVFAFDIFGVELMNPSGRTSERIVEVGGEGQLPQVRNIDDFSVSGRLLAGHPIVVHDTLTELDRSRPGDRMMIDAGIRSFVLVPLLLPLSPIEHARGVIYLAKRRPWWFDDLDVETLRGLADPITLAIHHHRRIEQNQRIAAAEQKNQDLQQRLSKLKHELGARFGFERIIGRSRALLAVLERATKVAATETTVLITGESGTGKELVAHAIHVGSVRAEGPFVALNCAALPEALLESELFGHEKGAFTGAVKRKPGRFELAAGGTLFLDEVGELAPPVQAKLLRVLQQREYQTIGGTATLKADVRLIAATNRDLAGEVTAGRFREDLLYRLNVFQVHLPALRDRGEDVLILAEHFVRELEASMGKHVPGISQDARRALLDYPWPGNIRELQNAIERAMILSDGGLIQATWLGLEAAKIAAARAHIGQATPGGSANAAASHDDGSALDAGSLPDWERKLVVEALQKAGGNKSRAAEILGVTRSQLYTRMKRFGL
ncbi:MAG: sigma 54-interacting transcriptional regulator [Planctomycetota bacterium]